MTIEHPYLGRPLKKGCYLWTFAMISTIESKCSEKHFYVQIAAETHRNRNTCFIKNDDYLIMTTQQKNTYYFMDTQTQRAQSTADKCTKAQTHTHSHSSHSHSSRPIFSALLALLHALAIAAAHLLSRRRRRGRGHSAVVGVIRHQRRSPCPRSERGPWRASLCRSLCSGRRCSSSRSPLSSWS